MKKSKNEKTEVQILEAAKNVFQFKGMDGSFHKDGDDNYKV